MIIYGLKNCDSCRMALKSLPDVEFVDIRKPGVPVDVLVSALGVFGAKFVNRRSTTWRELGPEGQAGDPLALLKQHPTLMKRPLIVRGDQMWLGWTPETRAALGVG